MQRLFADSSLVSLMATIAGRTFSLPENADCCLSRFTQDNIETEKLKKIIVTSCLNHYNDFFQIFPDMSLRETGKINFPPGRWDLPAKISLPLPKGRIDLA
jgi:hypothetical protein